jgi:hypothetical protein
MTTIMLGQTVSIYRTLEKLDLVILVSLFWFRDADLFLKSSCCNRHAILDFGLVIRPLSATLSPL